MPRNSFGTPLDPLAGQALPTFYSNCTLLPDLKPFYSLPPPSLLLDTLPVTQIMTTGVWLGATAAYTMVPGSPT